MRFNDGVLLWEHDVKLGTFRPSHLVGRNNFSCFRDRLFLEGDKQEEIIYWEEEMLSVPTSS